MARSLGHLRGSMGVRHVCNRKVGGWRLLVHSEQCSIYMQGWIFGSQCTVGDSVGHCRTDIAQVAGSLCLPLLMPIV